MLIRTAKAILSLFFLFISTATAVALSSDIRLLQLVPPESLIIASSPRPPAPGQPTSFLFLTEKNRIDLQDFFAVSGVDTSRSIHQVVFVAGSGQKGILSEHSLLVSGHFDRDAIFRFGDNRNAKTESYRGIPLLVIPAFSRELATLNEMRWLAILDSNIAIFGTIESVQRELDRYLANSQPDPLLMERLSRLDRADDTWCLLPTAREGGVVQSILEKLDPELGAVVKEGGPLEFGIHFGRRVEITASAAVVSLSGPTMQVGAPVEPSPAVSYFLLGSVDAGDGTLKRTIVKLPRRRYQKWLVENAAISPTIGGSVKP